VSAVHRPMPQVDNMAGVSHPSGGANSNVKRAVSTPAAWSVKASLDAIASPPSDGSALIGPKPSLFDPHPSETQ